MAIASAWMNIRPWAMAAMIAASVLPGALFGQSPPDEPIQATLCELATVPERFNGKIIAVRGPIQIAFENFTFSLSECESRTVDDVWLEYGRGPKRQPTTWCCGD